MPMQFVYDSTDLGTSVTRLGQVPGFITDTQLGAAGVCGQPFDDVAGTLVITGWKPYYVNELAGPIGTQRLWTGFIGERTYGRSQNNESLITGASRRIETTLIELNALFSFRLFPPTDTNANRPSETDVARMQWLLTTTYLTTTYGSVHDNGLVNTSGPVTLDAADYRGQTSMSLMSDCSNASGKNFWLQWDETHGNVQLFYDFDYSTAYSCTLKLSNVLSDVDGVTTFAVEPDAILDRAPDRVYSGVQVPFSGTGSPVYRTLAATASTFQSRDTTAPNVNVKTAAAANALGDRYLASIATEFDKVTCRVKLPAAKVPLMRSGMRVPFRSSFMPSLSSFTYCRIIHLEAKQDETSDQFYDVALELTPPEAAPPVTHVGPFCFYMASSGFGGSTKIQFTMNNPGDGTKRAYGYVTTGSAGATVFGDEFTVIPGPPNYNFTCSADSTAGNGTGVDGTTLLAGLYPTVSAAGLYYDFSSGVPVTFNFYVTYYAAGGLAYTNGAELVVPSNWRIGITLPDPIAHMTYVQGAGTPASVAPTGTLFIGSVTMTYVP